MKTSDPMQMAVQHRRPHCLCNLNVLLLLSSALLSVRAWKIRTQVNLHKPECMFYTSMVCTDDSGSFCSSLCFKYCLTATDLTLPASGISISGRAAVSALGIC